MAMVILMATMMSMAMATTMMVMSMATVILIMMATTMMTMMSTVMAVQRASASYASPNGERQGMTPHHDHDHEKSNSITS